MLLAGQNLYRVVYKFPNIEMEFARLVVADSETEAKDSIQGSTAVELVERDISLLILDKYLEKKK